MSDPRFPEPFTGETARERQEQAREEWTRQMEERYRLDARQHEEERRYQEDHEQRRWTLWNDLKALLSRRRPTGNARGRRR
ncbi:MAG: hypothetical protein WAW42_02510 [Candidatus Competibacteraceae bacterium]